MNESNVITVFDELNATEENKENEINEKHTCAKDKIIAKVFKICQSKVPNLTNVSLIDKGQKQNPESKSLYR